MYDMAVVSRLAAESYLTQKGLCLALELGPHTYVGEHQLICRKGESANGKRVGLDNRSAERCIRDRGIVLATGGGSVKSRETRNRLSARGVVVYLETTIEKQLARTQRDKKRPLLHLSLIHI